MIVGPMAVVLGRLALRNPVLAASGTYGSGLEAALLEVDLSSVGGVVTKSVTTQPRRGNPPPRIWETHGGMLNSIGLMNPGIDVFLAETLPKFRGLPCARIVNVAGESLDDFESLVARLDGRDGIDAIELNVSCPNVSGGLDYGTDASRLEEVVTRCRRATSMTLIVKLTPNVTDVASMARAAVLGGADALSLVNTYEGMAVDWRTRRVRLGSASGRGGLSGPAIKPLALSAVAKVRAAVQVPLIGIGGITSGEDALEFIVCGATAVQVGTANFLEPGAPVRIVGEMETLLRQERITDISGLLGSYRLARDGD